MRIFIAFTPKENIRLELFEIAKKFNAVCKGKKVEFENIHITFFFWQDIDNHMVNNIVSVLGAFNYKPFHIDIEDISIFYRKKIPSVINLPVNNENIIMMKKKLDYMFEKNIIDFEKRKFIPHITLKRIKHIDNIDIFLQKIVEVKNSFKKISFCLDSLTLYQSILKKTGPKYKIIYHKKLI